MRVAIAACLFMAGCAVQGPVVDGPLSPAPASTLVSKRELQFKVARQGERTVLVHVPAGAQPMPVASITGATVWIERSLPDDVRAATIEHLYGLVLRMDPVEVARHGRSHDELLRELAHARRDAGSGVAWRVVALAPGPKSGDADEVAVRVTSLDRPVEGMSVFFHKAPHLGCTAKIDGNGLASCHLVDHHGHDEEHDGHDTEPVVVTFPGEVRKDLVLLPTTLVLR